MTEHHEKIYRRHVRAGQDWTPERLTYFVDNPLPKSWLDEFSEWVEFHRPNAEAGAARLAELSTLVAAVTGARRPSQEVEDAANEVCAVL